MLTEFCVKRLKPMPVRFDTGVLRVNPDERGESSKSTHCWRCAMPISVMPLKPAKAGLKKKGLAYTCRKSSAFCAFAKQDSKSKQRNNQRLVMFTGSAVHYLLYPVRSRTS